MNRQSGTVRTYEHDFLLDETKLRKIVNVIVEQAQNLTTDTFLEFYVERETNSYYITQDLDEVLQDDNVPGKAIRILVIELRESNSEATNAQRSRDEQKYLLYLGFSAIDKGRIRLSVKGGSRDWTSLIADDVATQVDRTLIKKGFLRLVDYADFIVGAILIYSAWSIGFWLLQAAPSQLTQADIAVMPSNEQTAEILRILVARSEWNIFVFPACWLLGSIVGAAMIMGRPIFRWMRRTRTSFFKWGDMIQFHDKIQDRNTVLKVVVALGLLISIIGSIIGTLIVN